MDPVSVASLVAACASLATNCVKAAEALRSLVDRYKQAELSILSLVEECATIQLAWRGIEKWAEKNIQQMDSHEEIAERLARSVYAGQLIMSALQEDIGNLAPKTGGFRRRASLSWSDDLIREHQNRIRGQTNALQLLLQVISMPQSEERAEVLTIKEDVFRKVDDSVLSIIPSRLSSRLSITGSDWGSIRSNATGNLRYIPFSFDNDLFTSYVYKRNYRPLSNLRKSITDDYGNQLRDQSMDEYGAMKESASIFEMKRRDYIRTVRAQYDRVKDAWSGFRATAVLIPQLSLQPGIDIPHKGHLDSFDNRELRKAFYNHNEVERSSYRDIISRLQEGGDIVALFHPRPIDPARLINFLWYAMDKFEDLFITVMQRIAFWAGSSWIADFKAAFLENQLSERNLASDVWQEVENAATYANNAQRLVKDSSKRPSSLELACTARIYGLASYLLRTGFRPVKGEEHKHPLVFARVHNDKKLEEIFQDWSSVPDILSAALDALVRSARCDSIHWSTKSGLPIRLSAVDAAQLFIQHGAHGAIGALHASPYGAEAIPVIHSIAYAIGHLRELPEAVRSAYRIFELLLQSGVSPDISGSMMGASGEISLLALAAYLNDRRLVDILLKNGAREFAIYPSFAYREVKASIDSTMMDVLKASGIELAWH